MTLRRRVDGSALIAAFVASIFSASAFSATWTKFADRYEYDAGSVVRTGQMRVAWIRFYLPDSPSKHTLIRGEFDCEQRTYRQGDTFEDTGDGVQKPVAIPDVRPAVAIPPGNQLESLYAVLCQRKPRKEV